MSSIHSVPIVHEKCIHDFVLKPEAKAPSGYSNETADSIKDAKYIELLNSWENVCSIEFIISLIFVFT
jgi:hypothetical protein